MSEERVRPVTATSFTSFADAAKKALNEMPEGPGNVRTARVTEQAIEDGGVVGRVQYKVTLVQTNAGPHR